MVIRRREGPGRRPRGQFGRQARRVVAQLGRRLLRLLVVVLVVVMVRHWLGVWPTAVLVATAGTVGMLAAWAALDRRLFAPRPGRARLVERGPRAWGRPLDAAGHAAFARALAAVTGAYLTECERQEREARQ